MSRREEYETRTQALLEPIAREYGVSVYDVEYVKEGADYHLCAYIDKPEGVNIQDCENVSRALSDALDREDFIADAYVLEVSSPGLGRALKKEKHLQAAMGREVEIKLYKPVDKCREFAGVLEGVDKDSITILEGETARTFRRTDVAQVRLAIDF
nr:ribosome maturation factor RimP [uncultured Acetatifactor sp.]